MRKTKIVCTLGPATDGEGMLREMMLAGMNVARFNFSHGTHDEHRARLDAVKKLRGELHLPVAAMLDTKGPEVRLRSFEHGSVHLQAGQTFTLTTEDVVGDETRCAISYSELPQDVHAGDTILLDDGLVRLTVLETTAREIRCRVENSGEMKTKKGVNVPGVSLSMPYMSQQDKDDLLFGVEEGFDFVAASFVRCAADVREIRRLLDSRHSKMRIIAKIENQEGVSNLSEILAEADGIMVARGDMGVEIDFTEIPAIQKNMIAQCVACGKPVITATQMLDSMIRNPRPTRAEASDVANAIIDGTDAIMLSGETAAGKYPIEAVGTMVRIATYIEAHQLHDNTQLLQQEAVRNATVRTVANAVSYSCCQMARDLNANAIITPSNSGTTARMVARFRPDCPIIAPTPSEHAYHQLGLSYGVMPAHMGVSGDTDELINTAVEAAQQTGLIKTGDVVIISAGVPTGVSGTTNLIKAHIVGNVLLRGIGVGSGCASGNVCTVNTLSDLESDFKDGDVIVTKMTSSEMLPYMRRASAVVVESTNPECHAAVACQAMGIPMMMDRTYQAVHMLKSGMMITVDADEGFIYNGIKA